MLTRLQKFIRYLAMCESREGSYVYIYIYIRYTQVLIELCSYGVFSSVFSLSWVYPGESLMHALLDCGFSFKAFLPYAWSLAPESKSA